jgi:NAD(P)-dependent dehydrogenase (short-subunit alcohol dehydrogenase family)
MTTLAIIGAGKGLGAAVARRFGKEGFAVGLISRHQGRLDALAAELEQDGVQAKGFTADVRDPASIAAALEQVTETLGPIEVLQYSPLPQKDFMRPVLETTPEDLRGPVEFSIYGPVAAVHQVVPGMRFLKRGGATPSIIFINGGSAVKPGRNVTGTSVAFAGQAAYAELLHEVLGEEDIYVGQLIIGGAIVAGDKEKDPDVLADRIWQLHSKRDTFREQVSTD